MAPLDTVTLAELREALERTTEKKPTQRLMVAILYKQGPSVPTIADWFDLREATIYRWFDEMEAEPIERAVRDDPRPGRPPKLTDEERESFEAALQKPPEASGYDAPEWTPDLARTYIVEEFEIEYTLRHVRRLLKNVNVSWKTAGHHP